MPETTPNATYIGKFYVNFYDPDLDIDELDEENSDRFDENGSLIPDFHGEINIHMTEQEETDWHDRNGDTIGRMKTTYGTLDYDGCHTAFGFESHEIALSDMHLVFDTFCKLLKDYRTDNITDIEIFPEDPDIPNKPRYQTQMETPMGTIAVRPMPDDERPGICVDVLSNDLPDTPGVILEYDPDQNKILARIHPSPYGNEDPIAILTIAEGPSRNPIGPGRQVPTTEF